MKIAWFTPFDRKSAIGKVGLQICEHLVQKGHQADIWCYESKETLETNIPIFHYKSASLNCAKLKEYDHVVYNMGNFAGYHWAVYEAMLQFPGILILHDRTMHNFFKQYSDIQYGAGSEESNKAFINLVREEYGIIGIEAMKAYDSSDVITMNEYITYFSFIRKMCENATGVFTHSRGYSEQLKNYTSAATGYSFLPCKDHTKEELPDLPRSFPRDRNKLLVVSSGIVHPVKHIREMADVMLKNEVIRDRIQYVIIGDYGGEYGNELQHIASTSLKDSLFILGYQPDEAMKSFLGSADICINLRYPNSEACSLSLLEQMSYGKPVVVYNSGIYGEMADDTVYKIGLEDTEEQLTKALLDLIQNPEKREELGTNALQFIRTECTLDKYCEQLINYLNKTNDEHHYELFNRVISDLHDEMKYLGYNCQDIPEAMEDIAERAAETLNAEKHNPGEKNTFAIWAAFPYVVSGLHREGVMKLNSRLTEALLDTYASLCIEIWTYEVNREEVEISFQKVLEKDTDRVKIISESNWKKQLNIPKLEQNIPLKISIEEDNLGTIACKYSSACVFVPVILYLDNVLQTHRPVYVPAMDMSVKYYYEEFTYRDPNRKFHARDIEGRVNRMFRRGMGGYCMSQPIKETQILPLLRNAKDEDIGIVWTPDMTSARDGEHVYSEEVLKKLGIRQPYLFYPTQFRPNKNIETLMKAFEIVIKDYPNLTLVFTGHLEDLPDLHKEWKKLKSYHSLVFLHDLSEEELFNVYHYASCVPVTTVMEGGFPAQAIEALKMNVPIVLADIPVVEERLTECNLTKDNCGLLLFESYDDKMLADRIKRVLANPDNIMEKQRTFWKVFSQYTWKEAAEKHYKLLMHTAGF